MIRIAVPTNGGTTYSYDGLDRMVGAGNGTVAYTGLGSDSGQAHRPLGVMTNSMRSFEQTAGAAMTNGQAVRHVVYLGN